MIKDRELEILIEKIFFHPQLYIYKPNQVSNCMQPWQLEASSMDKLLSVDWFTQRSLFYCNIMKIASFFKIVDQSIFIHELELFYRKK